MTGLHIHWRRPVGWCGPTALSRYGATRDRIYRCRCGQEWVREERVVEPRWRAR